MSTWFRRIVVLSLFALGLLPIQQGSTPTRLYATGSFSADRNATDIPVDRREAELDWEEGVLRIRLESRIPDELARNPTGAQRVQRSLDRRVDKIYLEAVSRIQLNSTEPIGEPLNRDAELVNQIRQASDALRERYAGPSADLTHAAVEYALELHPELSRRFAPHTRARSVPTVPGWYPSRAFTGIVIYATNELPVHGTDRSARPVPALLPRLHDHERYEVVFEPRMVEPEYLERWGPVGYTSPGGEDRFLERVGPNPMRVLAAGVYGTHPTDLMIPREDVLRLLSRTENRRLLAEGRVLIVVDEQRIRESVLAD